MISSDFQVKKNDFVEFSLENKLLDITGVSVEYHIRDDGMKNNRVRIS